MKRHRLFVPFVLLTLVLGGCFAHPFAGTGSISVTSDPPNGKVYLNGEDTGKVTPVVLENIPTGVHTIRVEFPGIGEEVHTVLVQKGKQSVVHIDLGKPSVTGFVSHMRGGGPIEGATIVAYEAGTQIEVASTTTDAHGVYRLYLPDGHYDIVATKPNHAEGRAQRVVVENNHPVTADIMLPTIFDPTKDAVAPVISVTGVEPGDVIDEPVVVTINVDAEHPIDVVRVWLGYKDPNRPLLIRTTNSFSFFIDPADHPAGNNVLIIDTYDIQYNWAEVRIPLEIAPEDDAEELFIPRVVDVSLHAVTYGMELHLFRLQRAELHQNGLLSDHPNQLRLHDGTLIDLASGRADATMQITVRWTPAPNAVAYEIQRAWSADGPWETIAKLPDYAFTPSTGPRFDDYSPALQPNVETFYRIRGIGPNGELGEFSTPISVTPLGRFEVRLVAPADDAVGVPLTPTFEWEHNGVGAHQVFYGYVRGATAPASELYVWAFGDEDITSVRYNYDGFALQDLKPGTYYRWDIYHAYAYTQYGRRSLAQSFAREGRYIEEIDDYINGGSINGEFSFVTAYESN